MNTSICTFYIGSTKYKTIASIDTCLYLTDDGLSSTTIKLQQSNIVSDPQLRSLSSAPYIVTTNDHIYADDKTYRVINNGTLPKQIQYKIIPILNNSDIIEYQIQNPDFDEFFITQNYVKELKEAQIVLIPTDPLDIDRYSLGDLLVKSYTQSKDYFTFIAYSGVTVVVRDRDIVYKKDRYMYVSDLLIKGTPVVLPLTYTKSTLCSKYNILQNRLNEYGRTRIESINSTLRSIPNLLNTIDNKFMASSIYTDVSNLVDKIKNLN